MEQESKINEPAVIAFLDLGTNSVRLLLARVNPNLSYTVIARQKEVIRLGEGEFIEQTLQPEAMQRAVLICRQFAELARSRQAREIHVVATSAAREASNKDEFVQMLKDQAGLDVRVVSGKEEARLIYLGVSSGLNIGDRKTLFIDIGGGSTETIVGDQHHYDFLETHPMGAIRLSSMFFLPGESGPVDASRYQLIQNYVRNAVVRTVQRLKEYPLQMVIGSSGTITNLVEVAYRHFHDREPGPDETITLKELSDTIRMLCSLPLAERREVPGINPARADIIIAGSAILETFLEELHMLNLRTSERGLLEGMLVDYLSQHVTGGELEDLSIRERSVLQLGRTVNFDENHARTVARLALELFDTARTAGLHNLDAHDRELLYYAALLHDTGTFIAYPNHQAHTYYLVHNAGLLGFDQSEIELIAVIALFHRMNGPSKKSPQFTALSTADQEKVRILSLFLRLAEGLDRSHASQVQHVRLTVDAKKSAFLDIQSDRDCTLEVWGANAHADSFKKVFNRRLWVMKKEPA